MYKNVNDQGRKGASIRPFERIDSISGLARKGLIALALSLALTGTACTKNSDDTQCGTPEWPCDEIVTDDSLEI